ncbi:kinesin-like protein KIFC1 [Pseudonaja textilis]|uniref:kinesin-like protein KIFC1 n=1 Tax=Pseudonaja textilis TaxID=8673 RepID=UPI000EA8D104|nr:kinesin-like protein KIFC1 [Pseudonaja textilis]
MDRAASRQPLAPNAAPESASRLPRPGLRGKRAAAADENAPPEPQKRARTGAAPAPKCAASQQVQANAAPGGSRPRAAPSAPRGLLRVSGRRRSSARATIAALPAGPSAGLKRRAAVLAEPPKPGPPAAAPGVGRERRRAPWDLKGQISDLQAKVAAYKERVQGLAGENETLKSQLGSLQQELAETTGRNGELSTRASLLASELQGCREQARESSQRVSELLEKEERLEERCQSQAQRIGQLEALRQELTEGSREQALQLKARERELLLSTESLAGQRQLNEGLTARLEALEEHLHQGEMERRCLHNALQELKGNIRVFCRVRPLLASERQAQKAASHLRFPADNNKSLGLSRTEESHIGRERKEDVTYDFHFDRVFPPSSSQESVFEEIALLVQSALDGYHVCIFAYGQTGSGKTYTMEGPEDAGPETAGVIPRAVRRIFETSREMEAKGWQYQFTANFLEIYNESLRDLLVLRPEQNGELEIRRVSQYTEELHVPNLSCVPISSEVEVQRLLLTAKAHRSVARTNLNERSSRSHSLFQLRVEGRNAKRGLHTSSVLSLVDLAGSERLDKSLSTGERLKETQAINTSLSTLGLVINALSNKEAHIPYRNSKLTYLLQNSLGGSSKMLMFVNISPLEENFAESLNSLRFARKVNECVIGQASSNRK